MDNEKIICKADIKLSYTGGAKIVHFVLLFVLLFVVCPIVADVFCEIFWMWDYSVIVFLCSFVVGCVLASIICKTYKSICARCSLSLNEKGIVGCRKKLFSNAQLNLPIDKVDNIMITESIWDKLRGGKTVAVRSTSGLIKFPWVQNADEFVSKTLAKIEEFKQSVKNENQKLVSAVAQNVSNSNDSSGNTSSATKIKELKSLLDDGLITQEEFDTKRKELLDKM